MYDNELREMLLIAKKRIRVIMLITVIMPVITGIACVYFIKPLYRTHATLLIGRPQGYEGRLEYSDILLSQKLAATYGEIAKSRHVSDELIKRLQLQITNEEIRRKIDVTLVEDTEIIKISVIDKSPEIASKMANEASRIFTEYVSGIMRIENIQFVDMAEVPVIPYKPKTTLNILISAAAGLMTGLLMALLLEYFDNTIKTQEDIENCFRLPVIGVIPEVRQTGGA